MGPYNRPWHDYGTPVPVEDNPTHSRIFTGSGLGVSKLETSILRELENEVESLDGYGDAEMAAARGTRIHALAVALAVVRGQSIGGN